MESLPSPSQNAKSLQFYVRLSAQSPKGAQTARDDARGDDDATQHDGRDVPRAETVVCGGGAVGGAVGEGWHCFSSFVFFCFSLFAGDRERGREKRKGGGLP